MDTGIIKIRPTNLNILQSRKMVFISLTLILAFTNGKAKTEKPDLAFSKLKEIAEKGNANAQFQLGSNYFSGGRGIEPDYVTAAYWFSQAAKQNLPTAQYNLGLCFEQGLGVAQDSDHALILIKSAADKGLEDAQVKAGFVFREQDRLEESANYFKLAAVQGNAIAQREFAGLLIKGRGVKKNPELAIKILQEVAQKGDAEAQLLLAEIFSGIIPEIAPNIPKMVEFLWQAATANLPAAQSKIGYCYEKGIGVSKDTELSVRWYRKAASQDYPPALINLGHFYATGKGVPMDRKEAFLYYRKAAELQSPTALFNVGVCFLTGKGVEKDEFKGRTHLLKAANLGDLNSSYYLGLLYEYGQDRIKKDLEKALKWYQKSAEQKDLRGAKAFDRLSAQGRVHNTEGKETQVFIDFENEILSPRSIQDY